MSKKKQVFIDGNIVKEALKESFVKLSPKVQYKNPVMFVVYIGSILTTLIFLSTFFKEGGGDERLFTFLITLFLWFTVLFANFAEAIAEGRGKAQADALMASMIYFLFRIFIILCDKLCDVFK